MKFKKVISFITIVCILVYLQGCTLRRFITPQELEKQPTNTITTVITIDGEVFEFIEGWAVLSDTVITGTLKDGPTKEIPLSQVKMVSVKKPSYVKTCLLGWVFLAGLLGVLELLFGDFVTGEGGILDGK